MSDIEDLIALANEASDFDPYTVIETLRHGERAYDHIIADVVEGMAMRIRELETTIQHKNRTALRGGSLRPNPRKRK